MTDPALDTTALRQLRPLVRQLHAPDNASLPHPGLVRLAGELQLQAGLTIDFEASRDLGEPMIVLRVPAQPRPHPLFDRLSVRELAVAQLVSEGLANKQIAKKLTISLSTVKDHVHSILEKTGLTSRTEVAAAFLGAL